MNDPNKLPISLRHKAYSFSLFVYETFESLPERGVLVQDIESGINRLLGRTASYQTADLKDRSIKDIIAEIRGIKVLLGIARDISLIERHPALELFTKVKELESDFSDLLNGLRSVSAPVVDSVAVVSGGDIGNAGGNDAKEIVKRPVEEKLENKKNELTHEATDKTEPRSDQLAGGKPEPTTERSPVDFVTSARQEALIEVLKRRDRVSVGELARLFSGRVGAKTLQRDLQDLMEKGRVLRQGDRRWAVYSLAN